MTLNELQKNCVKAIPIKYPTRGDEALWSLWGVSDAAGDLVHIYKKTLYEGAELPKERFVDDLCDIIRNVAVAAYAVDVDLESVMKKVAAACENKEEKE